MRKQKKKKKKKFTHCRNSSKLQRNIVGKLYFLNTYIHNYSLSYLGTVTGT